MSARDELPDLAALADPATVVGRQVADALDALDWWHEWSNQIAELIPDVFDGDEGQEAIILRAVGSLVDVFEMTRARAEEMATILQEALDDES